MNRLNGKVAIVTGAGSGFGMGAETVRRFAEEGARVIAADINAEGVAALESELTAAGHAVIAQALDVTSSEQWADAVALAKAEFGGVDILVNNAGTDGPSIGWEGSTEAEFEQIYRINALSHYLGIMAVAPELTARGGGSIVNISSLAAIIAWRDVHPGYIASKGASRSMTKSAAADFAKSGIRVNSVHPGLIRTPMSVHFTEDAGIRDSLLQGIPLGRLGESRDIADAVVFLASDESSYITGIELVVDGGYMIL